MDKIQKIFFIKIPSTSLETNTALDSDLNNGLGIIKTLLFSAKFKCKISVKGYIE